MHKRQAEGHLPPTPPPLRSPTTTRGAKRFPFTSRMEEKKASMSGQPPQLPKLSPLWDKALQNYREELAGDDDFRAILETGSLGELLNESKVLQPVGPQGRKALNSMGRMKPMIKLVNDFSAVLAVSFGTDAVLAALIWGSIRMILTVCLFPMLYWCLGTR